jgi:hypothetical protein
MGVKGDREADILKSCLAYLKVRGIFAWRANSGGTMMGEGARKRFVRFNGAPGCSDVVGVLPGGRVLALEVKRPGGRPTGKQQLFLDTVRRLGGLALCVHSLEELVEDLERLGG